MDALSPITTAHLVDRLYDAIAVGKQSGLPSQSPTARLLKRGRRKIAQKVGEEAVETVIEAIRGRPKRVVEESADLLYHLIVLWADQGVEPSAVWAQLSKRRGGPHGL
jgi:phosphoribosyl-ATP pyrophosphohydrolase